MKLLHVVPTYLPAKRYGGPIYSVHGLCSALVRRGHRVSVITTNVDGPGISAVPVGEPVLVDGVQIRYFPSPALRRLYWSPSMGAALNSRTADFDCVHLHSIFLWPTWCAARAARRCRVPYVLAPRGMLVKDLVYRRSRWVKQAWIRLVEKRNIEQAAALHVTSELEAREAEAFGFFLPPIATVPNGIDISSREGKDTRSAALLEVLREPDIVVYLGRISWKKGLDRLILAFSRVPKATLVVAGNDEENYRPKLEQLARQSGIRQRVHFVGPVYGSDKATLLRKAALLVLPSYSENFGNVVLEAMAAGCPVVVTPDVGAASIVEDARAGVVTTGQPEALGDAIAGLLSAETKRKEMGRRGAAEVSAHYTWDVLAGEMERAYLDVIERSARAGKSLP